MSTVRPMVNSRPIRSTRSQASIAIAIRLTTIAVAPASRGSGSGPDQMRSGSATASGLTVPSTWPIRLRIDVPVGWVPTALRNPRWVQRRVTNAAASLVSSRVAWVTVIGSSAATWSTRSPPDQASWSLSIGNDGSGRSHAGAQVLQPGRRERTRAEAECHRQARRCGGQLGLGVRQARSALGQPFDVIGPDPHEPDERLAVRPGEQVEGREGREGLGWGRDAGLPGAAERHGGRPHGVRRRRPPDGVVPRRGASQCDGRASERRGPALEERTSVQVRHGALEPLIVPIAELLALGS